MTEQVVGQIVDMDETGAVTITASVPRLDVALMRKYDKVTVRFHDGRKISPDQQRLAWALLNEIGDWAGYMRQEVTDLNRQMKLDFITSRMEGIAYKMFSLSNVDMTVAKEYIEYLIAFIVKHGIPTKIPLWAATEEVAEYVYSCLMSKRCAVCGKPAQLHHVDSVGANGGNRDKINHIGLRCLPLCAEHHQELHASESRTGWYEAYHLEPIEINRQIAKLYKLNTEG